MAGNKNIKVVDYEKSVASAFIAGGIFIGVFVIVFLLIRINFDLSMFRTAPPIVLMVLILGCAVSVGFGIYKNTVFSRKQDEFEDFKRIGKKFTGKITSVKNGLNIDYGNRSGRDNINSVIIAVCTVTDEETGEEITYYSRKLMCIGNIIGMTADVYVYPSGQYYVDTENLRASSSSGVVKVHDFR